ncbi:PotD/PotF family extracellular solute-binding protein [Ensifer canadensis]|uniref:ABC transporter substrate-binding protein n=1 Tax=Ensifer canadensis TaxID=555315 RepID=UPI0035E3C44D
MNISRRAVLSGASAALAANAFALPGLARAQSQQVIVGLWGGDYGDLMQKLVDQPLLAPKGVEVLQVIGDEDTRKTKLLAERQSRRASMDVVFLGDDNMYLLAQQGLFEEMSPDKASRLSAVKPELRKPYSVPQLYSYRVILYNSELVASPPRSYAELSDPKWRGRIGLADDDYLENVQAAALAAGGKASDLELAKQKLIEWRDQDMKIYPSNEALAAALKSGEIWITVLWLARGVMWQKASMPLKAIVPAEGAMPVTFEAAVPRNARNKEAAWQYINALLEVSAQAGFTDKMGYLPTVTDARLPAELESQLTSAGGADMKLLTKDYPSLVKVQDQALDFWNKQFKG